MTVYVLLRDYGYDGEDLHSVLTDKDAALRVATAVEREGTPVVVREVQADKFSMSDWPVITERPHVAMAAPTQAPASVPTITVQDGLITGIA